MAARGLNPTAESLPEIDWQRPWLADWRALGLRTEHSLRQGLALHEALNLQAGHTQTTPVQFVSQTELPPGLAYEQFVFKQRSVPTREGAHDFFNGLCWLQFPCTKQKLNALQAAQIAADGVGAVRGPVRDAVTVFDENAALFTGPAELWKAIQAHDWPSMFVTQRQLWTQSRLILFGHALLEKLLQPRKSITAHVYQLDPGLGSMSEIDEWLAQDLSAEKLASKPFVPLPVLGVPFWWSENDEPSFYRDAKVFRTGRNTP